MIKAKNSLLLFQAENVLTEKSKKQRGFIRMNKAPLLLTVLDSSQYYNFCFLLLTEFPVDSATSLCFSLAFGGGERCFVSQTEMELL